MDMCRRRRKEEKNEAAWRQIRDEAPAPIYDALRRNLDAHRLGDGRFVCWLGK